MDISRTAAYQYVLDGYDFDTKRIARDCDRICVSVIVIGFETDNESTKGARKWPQLVFAAVPSPRWPQCFFAVPTSGALSVLRRNTASSVPPWVALASCVEEPPRRWPRLAG